MHEDGDEADSQHSPMGNNNWRSSANIDSVNPYREQIDHQARRSSSSAASIAQYSLPPSDTQTSFDDSTDRLHPRYGDDSFVNELVPMFPKPALPPPPHFVEDDSQALEEYDVQLVAPNMSRMLTADHRSSFGRSRQRLASQERQAVATPNSRSQPASIASRNSERSAGSEKRAPSSSRRYTHSSSSDSSDFESGVNSSVEERHHPASIKQTRRVTIEDSQPTVHQVARDTQSDMANSIAVDNQSDISSESGVSSLGFTVQLNLAAGISRKRNNDEYPHKGPRHTNPQQHISGTIGGSDDERDKQSEKSFASSSSMSVDAHFNYLSNMTSAVGKSLPLHLRLPAMIFGKKDMTKPPAPVAWSASPVSSIASETEAGPNDIVGMHSQLGNSIALSSSSRSDSSLEEQYASSPSTNVEQNAKLQVDENGSLRSFGSSDRDIESEESSESGEQRVVHLTFDHIQDNVSRSLPPPLGNLDMSVPPAPLEHLNRSIASSDSSSERSSQVLERRQIRHRVDLYEAGEERKMGDSISDSSSSSPRAALLSSSNATSRRRRAEKIVIPMKEGSSDGDSDGGHSRKEMSLAEAFQRRHPRFGRRLASHRDKLKRQSQKEDEQQQKQQQEENESELRSSKLDASRASAAAAETARSRGASADPLPQEKQDLLNRLASGSRAKISSREMKERSRRLYQQLPEVVERKRQEEVMRRRRERLNELRQQEKVRHRDQSFQTNRPSNCFVPCNSACRSAAFSRSSIDSINNSVIEGEWIIVKRPAHCSLDSQIGKLLFRSLRDNFNSLSVFNHRAAPRLYFFFGCLAPSSLRSGMVWHSDKAHT
ncbi:unnamed protein product [Phytophthora fragariaefolia]|uniref:Unnamed protein product n=1 Tax=Phytophthora fragariaefolia TaxID=1490495 RepID=A0A9W6TWH0_9STRA|nr:unnamed protein product [Phytophthora fragariaefolia]